MKPSRFAPPQTPGTAGGSAAREAARLEALFAPHATCRRRPGNNPEIARWRTQAIAEHAVGRILDIDLPGARVLHDRTLPDGRQLDHLVIAATGLYVVETRAYPRPLTYDKGTLWDGNIALTSLLADVCALCDAVCQDLANSTGQRVSASPLLALHRTVRPRGYTAIDGCAIIDAPDLPNYITAPLATLTPLAIAGLEATAEQRFTPA